MRGRVLGVDARTGDGLVAGDDGRRYTFQPADWASRGEPAIGIEVDFDADDRRALSIYPIPAATPPVAAQPAPAVRNDRNKYVAAVIAFLLGSLGIHRFYLGRTGSGIAMLVLTCTVVGLLITGPWAFIDMIRYLVMSEDEFAARYRRD
ncbi:TM2 domain-containing protein [Sphingomonas sp. CFBP 8760]|uniref:TM2 domain-containing protein n=1 Tax=Sphingomonas sp. CFBP 8760 TaxID=2775282 RepID=UPI001783F573|nr:TM2 domain-containing protein [Sphingomonas sp. CFBP 8760]MBD8545578.1 TM2 domain-containing protein [Sphingomonas sp. CFBP 8760]